MPLLTMKQKLQIKDSLEKIKIVSIKVDGRNLIENNNYSMNATQQNIVAPSNNSQKLVFPQIVNAQPELSIQQRKSDTTRA